MVYCPPERFTGCTDMPELWISSSGVNRKQKEIWIPSGSVNRKQKELWAGSGGVNRKIFSGGVGYTVALTSSPTAQVFTFGSDGSGRYNYFRPTGSDEKYATGEITVTFAQAIDKTKLISDLFTLVQSSMVYSRIDGDSEGAGFIIKIVINGGTKTKTLIQTYGSGNSGARTYTVNKSDWPDSITRFQISFWGNYLSWDISRGYSEMDLRWSEINFFGSKIVYPSGQLDIQI